MKKFIFCWLVFGIAFPGFSGGALAEEKYPARAIEMVIPFGPGGSADVAARAYSDNLARILKVPIVLVNRAGGTGVTGAGYVIKAKKDGYTLLASTDTPLMVMPVISKEVMYDPLRDLVPLGHFGYALSVIAVRKESPFKTLAELVEYARKNPGKLKNASSGVGTESYFNLELLCHKENISIPSIPFKSGGENLVSLLGGHTDLSTSSLASLSAHLKAGTIRALAICAKKRHLDFPDVPSTAELGYPDMNLAVWLAVYAPAGVPKQVIDVLVPAVKKAFTDPEVIKRGVNAGLVVEYLGPEETRKLLTSGLELIKVLAKKAGLAK
jgi:tripartite-type tricarboxylate transporter receptor subunit TctC